MNNSNRRAAAVAVSGGKDDDDDDARPTRLPHLRYTGLFSEKGRIARPTAGGGTRPFTSFGRPWLQVESSSQSSVNPTRQSAEDSHFFSSSSVRDLAASNHRAVEERSGTGEPKYKTQIGGHRSRDNGDAVGNSTASHVLGGFVPPPPEFSDIPSSSSSSATAPPRSMSRMFVEIKSISSSAPTTVLDRPKTNTSLSPTKTVVEKAKESDSDDGINDDDDDVNNDDDDVPPPPLPTSSPSKIPFSFLHTSELENDAVGADDQKPKATTGLALSSVQSLFFGVESDSSESREDDARNELFSSNDEISKFSSISTPCTDTKRTRAEKSNATWEETVKLNGDKRPPVLSSIGTTNNNNSFLNPSGESFRAAAPKSSADRRYYNYNTTALQRQEEIKRTSHLEGVESCNVKNADNIARDSPQRNEISVRNARYDFTPTTTTTTAEPLYHHTSAENPFSISDARSNPSDKDYGIDRVNDQRGYYTVDSARNQSKERRDRSKGSEAVRQIGIANLMNTNAKNQTDETDDADRRIDKIDDYINGSPFDDSTQERRDYYGNKTSSLLLSSHHNVNTDRNLLKPPNKLDRPLVLAEKEKCIKPKMFSSTLSLYQHESEESASARNNRKKQFTFDNLDKKLRDDARDRLQKLKSPNGSTGKPSFPTSGSGLPVIANNSTSTRGVLLSRDSRRSPNYETVLFPPRFGFQPPSFSGSLSRRKPGSLEDLRDWGTRSLPRNMECSDKWSVAKFDDSIDNNYQKEEEEEGATEEAKDNRSSAKYYENHKKSTNEGDKYGRDGYHRLAFSLPRPAKKLQLQSADSGNTNKNYATAKETRQNKISSSSNSTSYSYPRTFAATSYNNLPQPNSNLSASNSTLSVFVPSVPPITADIPDSTVLASTRPSVSYQNLVQKSSFSTDATSVLRSIASREIPPNISRIPIDSEDKIPPYFAGHSLSRLGLSSSPSSAVSPRSGSFSGNHFTQSSPVSTHPVFSEALSHHLQRESSAPDSVSDSASTASAPVEFSGGDEHLSRPPPDDGGLSPQQLNESKEDMADSELDASFTYFPISHNKNNNQTKTEPPPPPPKISSPKFRSNLTVSLSPTDRLIVSDPVPSNQRPPVNGRDARVSSVAGDTRQPTGPPRANDSSENSADTFLRNVNYQSHIVGALQSKKFAANEDEFSELRTSKTNEPSKENLHWKPLRRERIAEYKEKEPLGNGNTDNNSHPAVAHNGIYGVHSSSLEFSESLTNNKSANSAKHATEVHYLGHHKLHSVDEQTTPRTESKTSEESRPVSNHSTIGTETTKTFATELPTKASLPEYGGGRSQKIDSKSSNIDENLKRYENKRKPWSTGRQTENQNQIGKDGTPPRYMETRSSSISRWKISDEKEDRGSPSPHQGHTKPPPTTTPEGGGTARDSQTRNRTRGLEPSSFLVGSHRTTETDRKKTVPSFTTKDYNRGNDDLIRIDIVKGNLGICFCLEGGRESPHGDGPIRIKRIFHGAPDFNVGREQLRAGDELVSVNGQDFTSATHYAAWKHLRTLPEGIVTLVVRRALAT